jgi:hypothetical protein
MNSQAKRPPSGKPGAANCGVGYPINPKNILRMVVPAGAV